MVLTPRFQTTDAVTTIFGGDTEIVNSQEPTAVTSEPKSFSSAVPWTHQAYVTWTDQATQGLVKTANLTDFINGWGKRWKDRTGGWPDDTDLFTVPEFTTAAQHLVVTTNLNLPPVFRLDGILRRRTFLDGMKPITDIYAVGPTERPEVYDVPTVTIKGVKVDATSPLLPAIKAGQVPPEAAEAKPVPFGGAPGRLGDKTPYPEITSDQLTSALNAGRGGGGGGGGTTRSVTFDRAKLIEQARDYWHALLLDNPGDPTIEGVVDSYIRDATAFYVNQGGQRDFQTFLLGRIREQPRHKVIYKWKPDTVNEADYIGAFAAPIQSLGLSPGRATEAVAAGAASGSSPTGAARAVTQSRSFSQRPGFSQRLAQSVLSLGAGVRR
jgi:hypothetical protein